MRLLWIILLCARLALSKDCPRPWNRWKTRCFMFSALQLPWEGALKACRAKGAALASINQETEARYVAQQLLAGDLSRKSWQTSGFYTERHWEWQGDGTRLLFSFWHINATQKTESQGKIAFVHNDGIYRWEAVDGSVERPFICEIGIEDLWKLEEATPDAVLYGLTPREQLKKPQRPRITVHPSDVVVYEDENLPQQQSVVLRCEAEGWPIPRIRWFKGSGGFEVDPSSSGCVSQVDGSLLLVNISRAEYGSYYCLAANPMGVERSTRVTVSPAFVRQFASSRLDVYGVAGLGKSLQCRPPDHFPRTLSYAWTYESVKNFLSESTRVFISRDGTLYFSFLLQSDQSPYSCSVVSAELQTGHYGPFFKLLVSTAEAGVPETFKPEISSDFPKIFPSQPAIGQEVRLECFAYARPVPDYRWERLDGPMPLKAQTQSHGRVLYIPQLTDREQGVYRCIATNQFGVSQKEITLTLHSAPKVLSPMVDRFAHPNSTVSFSCDLFGNPKPEIEWFRNGVPISPLLLPANDQLRFAINSSSLTITNVEESDSAIYQCVGSNQLGQISSSAYLAVRYFAPTFDSWSTNQPVYGQTGRDVTLPCRVLSSPSSTVLWRKNGRLLDLKGRFSRQETSLKIKDLRSEDSGFYSCVAANLLGTDSIVLSLFVIPPISVQLESSTEEFSPGMSVAFSCNSQPSSCDDLPGLGCGESVVQWSFNNRAIETLPQLSSQTVNHSTLGSTLYISNLSHSHSGLLMCSVHNAAGKGEKVIELNVPAPPLAPVRVKAENAGQTWVRLSWEMPGTDTVVRYRIRIKSQHETRWTVHENEILTTETIIENFQINDLAPFTEYKFRVEARNLHGWGKGSLATAPIRTLPAKPDAAVKILSAEAQIPGDIVLRWKPLDRSLWNDEVLSYKIEWSEENVTEISSQILPSSRDSFTIRTQSSSEAPCAPVRITFHAFNSQGNGPISGPLQVYPYYKPPSTAVTSLNLTVISRTALELKLEWLRDQNAWTQGCEPVVAFEINCWTEFENLTTRWLRLGRPLVSLLTGLKAHTQYFCQAIAVGPAGVRGPNGTVVSAWTNDLLSQTPPQIVKLEQKSDYVKLKWRSPENEQIEGYRLYLYHGETSDYAQELSVTASELPNPSLGTVRIQGLNYYNLYKVQVAAYSSHRVGPKSKAEQFRFGYISSGASQRRANAIGICIFLLPFYRTISERLR